MGMLAWFINGYVQSNTLSPDWLLVSFITSVLALAWALFTLFSYHRSRRNAFFVGIVDLLFVGAFIAGVYQLRWIRLHDCTDVLVDGQEGGVVDGQLWRDREHHDYAGRLGLQDGQVVRHAQGQLGVCHHEHLLLLLHRRAGRAARRSPGRRRPLSEERPFAFPIVGRGLGAGTRAGGAVIRIGGFTCEWVGAATNALDGEPEGKGGGEGGA